MAQVSRSPQATRHTSLDYSLPAAFTDLLFKPYDDTINSLLGPLHPAVASATPENKPKVPFLAAMATTGDTRTAKGALAHKSTDSPLVDLFYEFTPGVTSERLFELLEAAWKNDPKRYVCLHPPIRILGRQGTTSSHNTLAAYADLQHGSDHPSG